MKISVIIPTLNESGIIVEAVEHAWQSGADQVVVCDGGSQDSTAEIAKFQKCDLVFSAAGRGTQLNAGAFAAIGDIFLFLHADTALAAGGCEQIRKAVAEQAASCGAFRQHIASSSPVFRLIEFGNSLRVSFLGMAYGDQGLFVSRQIFEDLGGFEEIPLMEDFSFSQKLRKRNRIKLLDGPLRVSPRRWNENGPIRQTIANWSTAYSYLRGASPQELARKYHGNR